MFAAVMFGPSYEPQEPGPETIELFDNLDEAIAALIGRHRAHGRRPMNVDLLAGQSMALTFPAFGVGTAFQLYKVAEPEGDFGHGPSQISEIERHVKTYEWDYYISLDSDGHDTFVKVRVA